MKLAQGVLRSLTIGLSPRFQRCQLGRALSTTPAPGFGGNYDIIVEAADDFEKPIFGDIQGGSESSFFRKLDRAERAHDRYGVDDKWNASNGYLDGFDDSHSTLTDGMDERLKKAASYFEVDDDEIEQDDYKYRPDASFSSGSTYTLKDLDLRRPCVSKPPPRREFEVTTAEVLRKADFRNVRFLANFLTEAGVIIKRSQTKISAKAQRKVAREIKTARAFGLLPFTTMGTKHFAVGKTMEDIDEDFQYESYDTHNFVDDAPLDN